MGTIRREAERRRREEARKKLQAERAALPTPEPTVEKVNSVPEKAETKPKDKVNSGAASKPKPKAKKKSGMFTKKKEK